MTNTRLALLLAACATTTLGCADSAPTDQDTAPVTGSNAGGSGGGASGSGGSGSGGSAGNMGTGSSGAGTGSGTNGTAGEDDAAVTPPPDKNCQDDESTLGNDCPGLVTCTADVDSCSLSSQNCCVTAYATDGASCNEGTVCDGLTAAACDGPEDCPGTQQCCISVSLGIGGAEIKHRCVAEATECKGGLIVDRIMCHSENDCCTQEKFDQDECAEVETCQPIPNLPWWGQCKA